MFLYHSFEGLLQILRQVVLEHETQFVVASIVLPVLFFLVDGIMHLPYIVADCLCGLGIYENGRSIALLESIHGYPELFICLVADFATIEDKYDHVRKAFYEFIVFGLVSTDFKAMLKVLVG